MPILLLILAAILAFALSRLGLHRVGNALTSAEPGWIVLALALMALSLLLRAVSWHEVLRAALPDTPIAWAPVIRATMIGVMGSAVFPGRIGEPAKMLVLTRRLPGPRAACCRSSPAPSSRRPDQPARAGDPRDRHLHQRSISCASTFPAS